MASEFSMMPLWMTAMRPDWSVCGWALGVVGAPWVAQRVWPMPRVPVGMLVLELLLQHAELARRLHDLEAAPFTTAMPDES